METLPLVLYQIKNYLQFNPINCNFESNDGRNNSIKDEKNIINYINKKFKVIETKPRMWYDILVFDKVKRWIPVNIKTTTMKSADNISSIASILYSLTDYKMELNKSYSNGELYDILFKKIKNKNYLQDRDYYFLVINKTNSTDIIINSIKGLSCLTKNYNNLPFQVNWKYNREYNYINTKTSIKLFQKLFINYEISQKEKFIQNMHSLTVFAQS